MIEMIGTDMDIATEFFRCQLLIGYRNGIVYIVLKYASMYLFNILIMLQSKKQISMGAAVVYGPNKEFE
jgi:hypothetical protein